MKQLVIPEQHDINLGTYGPACEGFVDLIKSLFFKSKDNRKEKIEKIKNHRWPRFTMIKKELESDLKSTYDNPQWVEKNLVGNSGIVKIPALMFANVDGKLITKPEELAKIAQGMFSVIKEIVQQEKPYIELRHKLVDKIEKETDPAKVDQIWLDHEKQLSTTAADRVRNKKKAYPAFGFDTKKRSWPVDLSVASGRGAYEFSAYPGKQGETDGSFEVPTTHSAKHYAEAIRTILDICCELADIEQNTYIAYWDCLAVEYDDLKYGDDIFGYLCSSQGGWEVSDLASGAEGILSYIVCGLYIAMFDKHMPTPATEGFFDMFKSKKKENQLGSDDTLYKFDSRRAFDRICRFRDNPESFKLTEHKFSVADGLHLSIGGKSPVSIGQLATAYESTADAMLKLGAKFDKDRLAQARLLEPVIDKFERTVVAGMDKTGEIDQAILDSAMIPLIAVAPKVLNSYFHQFGKEQSQCDSWLGGNPFSLKEHIAGSGIFYDEWKDAPPPVASMPRADAHGLIKLFESFLKFSEATQPVFGEGVLDTEEMEHYVSYEWDRPVRHLYEKMNEEQRKAITIIYSHDSNSQGMMFSLNTASTKMFNSILKFIDMSITSI